MLDILARDLSTTPPQRRTRQDNHATLLVSWWATGIALVIILIRVIGRFIRTEQLFKEDKIMFWSIVPLLIRMALVHVIMLYGTNNVTTDGLSAEAIYERSIGSRLVLASRIFYALFIWTAKWTVSEFLKRLVSASWSPVYEKILRGIRLFLVVTFAGVVISTLVECHPFTHYWQVVPDPGSNCRNGFAQLLTMGIADIITDVALIVFPIPIIMRSQMPAKRKISLTFLFMLSAFLIVITIVRMLTIIQAHGRQQRRTLWASIEILAAAAVSNAVILGSFLRDRGVKKSKFKPATGDRPESDMPSINRTMTAQHWGNDSDHELFRSIASRMNSLSAPFNEERIIQRSLPTTPDSKYIDFNGDVGVQKDVHTQYLESVSRIEAMEQAKNQNENFDSVDIKGNGPTASGQQEDRGRRFASPTRRSMLLSIDTVATQDFAVIDWNHDQGPEHIELGDAGGLLGPAFVPARRRSSIRATESGQISPLSLTRASTYEEQTMQRRRQSSIPVQVFPKPGAGGPDDMFLGDAGGLLR